MKLRPSSAALHLTAVVVLATALIWPLFKTKYLENWTSIDATFIADARYLAENWPHPGWQPLWYGGTRFDYIYPPALRYGSAALAKYAGLLPARGYHLYTAILYVIGIGGVWLFVWVATRARTRAWLAAAGVALLSPSFLVLDHIRNDVNPYMPQRFNVLIRYGEGPHMSALALLPFVFAAAWWGLRRGHPAQLALAALAAALVVSNNFYGATALAIFFPVLTWAIFVTTRDWFVWMRAGAIALLAYGLTAFWLTPSYLAITNRNLAIVSQPGNLWSAGLAVLLAAAIGFLSWRRAAGNPVHAYSIFVWGGAAIISLNVLGHHWTGRAFRVAGEPERLVPELDLFLVLVGGEIIRRVWQRERLAAALLVLASFLPAWGYLTIPWRHIRRTSEAAQRLEYQIPEWVAKNRPGARTFAMGTVRFWWNGWFNEAQIGGGSEQGLINFDLMKLYWTTVLGNESKAALLWLQATGNDLIVMNDAKSALPIQDFEFPHRFDGTLPVVYDDGKGNWIHEIPRRWRSLARVVRLAEVQPLLPVRDGEDLERLTPYVQALEQGPDSPAPTRWLDPRTLRIEATVEAGEALAVLVSYDPSWRARADGREFPVERDALGQVRILAPAGTHRIDLFWETPRENQIGRMVFALAVVVFAWLCWRGRRG
ncbi:MAG: hypothetical protein INH43_22400 [Acidobacteriaceae bacterium]|nr:hypothetical protein [Acidobacteriaceae bacterium]